MTIPCRYCGGTAYLTDSAKVYKQSYGPIYLCENWPRCDAYVGCHPGTNEPLGTVADKELRKLRHIAHGKFDVLWKYKKKISGDNKSRKKAYAWLAERMDLEVDECHIGMFNKHQCNLAISIMNNYYKQFPRIARKLGQEFV